MAGLVGPVPARRDPAVAARGVGRRLEALDAALVDHRADEGRGVGDVPDREGAGERGEPLDELVVDGGVDDRA